MSLDRSRRGIGIDWNGWQQPTVQPNAILPHPQESRKNFFFTLDVEEDYGTAAKHKTFRGVELGIPLILGVLDQIGITGTFFVTGQVALAYRDIVKQIAERHEVAGHGKDHRRATEYGNSDLYVSLRECLGEIKSVTGTLPVGFRAVDLVMEERLLRMLDAIGVQYDSSVMPRYPIFKSYDGYRGKSPRLPYHPSHDYKMPGNRRILEMPISTTRVGNVPWVGTWMRVLGNMPFKTDILLFEPMYVLLGLHSWDFIELQGRWSRGSGRRFVDQIKSLLFYCKARGYEFRTLKNGARLFR